MPAAKNRTKPYLSRAGGSHGSGGIRTRGSRGQDHTSIALRGPRLGPTSGPQFLRLLRRQTRFGKPGSHSRSLPRAPELLAWNLTAMVQTGGLETDNQRPFVEREGPGDRRSARTGGQEGRRPVGRSSRRTCLPPWQFRPAPPLSPPDPGTPPSDPAPAEHAPPPTRPHLRRARPPGGQPPDRPAPQSHQAPPLTRPATPVPHPRSGPGFPHSRAEPAAEAERTARADVSHPWAGHASRSGCTRVGGTQRARRPACGGQGCGR